MRQKHNDMNSKPDDLSEPQSRLMDALLSEALSSDDDVAEQRVHDLMQTIRDVAPSRLASGGEKRGKHFRWFSVSVAAAALVLLLFVIQPWGTENAALAAVDRTILAEQRPEAREYAVTIVTRGLLGAEKASTHTLFVRQRDFAIRATPRLGRGDIWMGGSKQYRWIVPRFGPVLTGTEGLLRKSLPNRQVVETPFLSVATILDRMKRFYELELTPGVSLQEENATVVCDHVAGTPKRSTRLAIPSQVEVWADRQTGFARRIQLAWNQNDSDSRWLKATAQLVGTPELPEDFFDHSAHHDSDRIVNQVEK